MFPLFPSSVLALSACLAVTSVPQDHDDRPVVVKIGDTGRLVVVSGDGTTITADELELRDGKSITRLTSKDGTLVTAPVVTKRTQKRIGVTVEAVPEVVATHLAVEPSQAIMVVGVSPDEPAAKAGVRKYDIVTAVNGKSPVDQDQLRQAVVACEPGEAVELRVLRGGRIAQIRVPVEVTESTIEATDVAINVDGGRGIYAIDTGTGRRVYSVDAPGQARSGYAVVDGGRQPVLVQTAPGRGYQYVESGAKGEGLYVTTSNLARATTTTSKAATRAAVLAELEAIHARLQHIESLLESLK